MAAVQLIFVVLSFVKKEKGLRGVSRGELLVEVMKWIVSIYAFMMLSIQQFVGWSAGELANDV